QPAATFRYHQRGKVGPLPCRPRGGGNPLPELRGQRGLRLLTADTRAQAPHHLHPIRVPIQVQRGSQAWIAVHRKINIRIGPRIYAKDPGGATPATVNGKLSTRIAWPGAAAAPPKRLSLSA